MTKFDKIRSLHNFFIKKFKPQKKVVLQFRKMVYNGSYRYNGKKHYITLNKKDNLITLYDSEIHEFSHSLEHHKYGKNSHSEAWGRKFSIVYCAFLEWASLQKEFK